MARLIFVLGLGVMLMSSCHQSYMAVENETGDTVRVEIACDTGIKPASLAVELTYEKNGYRIPHDSLAWMFSDTVNPGLAYGYLRDSASIRALAAHNEFNIVDLHQTDVTGVGFGSPWAVDCNQRAMDYYHNDTGLVRKAIVDRVVTVFIPPGYTFYQRCHACGDCSCEGEEVFDPLFIRELRIYQKQKAPVVINRSNWQSIMEETRFVFGDSSKSCVLKLTDRTAPGIAALIIQAILSLIFLGSGVMKLVLPGDQKRVPVSKDIPRGKVIAIGIAELAISLGILLPTLLNVFTFLTLVTACGILVMMAGAMIYHIKRRQWALLVLNVVVIVLTALLLPGMIEAW